MKKLIPILLIIAMVAAIIGAVYIAFPPEGDSIMIAVSKFAGEEVDGNWVISQNEYVYVNHKGEFCSIVGSDNRFYRSKLRTILSEEDFNRLVSGEVFDFTSAPEGIYLKSMSAIKTRKDVEKINGSAPHKDLGALPDMPEDTTWTIKIKNKDGEVIQIAEFSHDNCWVLDDEAAVAVVKVSIKNWSINDKDYDMQKMIWKSITA